MTEEMRRACLDVCQACLAAVLGVKDQSGVNYDGQSWLMRATKSDYANAVRAIEAQFQRAHVLAAMPAPAAAPEGWQLVPTMPTQEMCQQGQWKAKEWPKFPLRISSIYQAMLAAAPTPQQEQPAQRADGEQQA